MHIPHDKRIKQESSKKNKIETMQSCKDGQAERTGDESRLNLKEKSLGHKYAPEKGLMNLEVLAL